MASKLSYWLYGLSIDKRRRDRKKKDGNTSKQMNRRAPARRGEIVGGQAQDVGERVNPIQGPITLTQRKRPRPPSSPEEVGDDGGGKELGAEGGSRTRGNESQNKMEAAAMEWLEEKGMQRAPEDGELGRILNENG